MGLPDGSVKGAHTRLEPHGALFVSEHVLTQVLFPAPSVWHTAPGRQALTGQLFDAESVLESIPLSGSVAC